MYFPEQIIHFYVLFALSLSKTCNFLFKTCKISASCLPLYFAIPEYAMVVITLFAAASGNLVNASLHFLCTKGENHHDKKIYY